jgi:hypothetical protein
MTSGGSDRSISSQGLEDGAPQRGFPGGPTTDLFGQPLAHVSHSARRGTKEEPMIQGICGRTYLGSLVPEGPLQSWESRLRDRLAMVGSTECALIWRRKTTPAGASMSRLSRSMRHMNGTVSTGSQSTERAPWSTPRASDGEKGSQNQIFSGGGQPLPAQMAQSSPRPTAKASAAGPDYAKLERSATGISLQTAMALAAMDRGGAERNGSSATMEKRAGSPTPKHPCWLMGYEVGFLFTAPTPSECKALKASPRSMSKRDTSAELPLGMGSETPSS